MSDHAEDGVQNPGGYPNVGDAQQVVDASPGGSVPWAVPRPCVAAPAGAWGGPLCAPSAPAHRRRIARDMPDQVVLQGPRNQRLVQAACQRAVGSRERESASESANAAPAAQPIERPVNLQPLDQRVVGMSNTALAMKARASAARSSGGRPGKPLMVRMVGARKLDMAVAQARRAWGTLKGIAM